MFLHVKCLMWPVVSAFWLVEHLSHSSVKFLCTELSTMMVTVVKQKPRCWACVWVVDGVKETSRCFAVDAVPAHVWRHDTVLHAAVSDWAVSLSDICCCWQWWRWRPWWRLAAAWRGVLGSRWSCSTASWLLVTDCPLTDWQHVHSNVSTAAHTAPGLTDPSVITGLVYMSTCKLSSLNCISEYNAILA